MDRSRWIQVTTVLTVCAVIAVVWSLLPTATWDLDAISAWMAPHRHVWYGLPLVMAAFVGLGSQRVSGWIDGRHGVVGGVDF